MAERKQPEADTVEAELTTRVPEQRQEAEVPSHTVRIPEISTPVPTVTVLGYMDSQIAIRLSWKSGMVAISQSRFRFLRDDLGLEVLDNQENYLF